MKTLVLILTALAVSRMPLWGQSQFQSVSQSGDMVTFTWSAVSGMLYQVQYSTNLSSGDWIDLGCPVLASGTSATDSDTLGSDPFRFYRVAGPIEPVITSTTGGNYTFTNGDYISVVFINSGTFTVVCGAGSVESLVVAGGGGGGGGGGSGTCSGGGAGGLIHTTLAESPNYGPGSYSVVVGQGGPASCTCCTPYGSGFKGGNSMFNGLGNTAGIVAYGGGGGTDAEGGGGSGCGQILGPSGGSGAGGSTAGASVVDPPGESVVGIQYGTNVSEGFGGGNSQFEENGNGNCLGFAAGGGGGAGAVGGNASNAFNGGAGGMGIFFSLTGDARFDIWYAGGGGGGGGGYCDGTTGSAGADGLGGAGQSSWNGGGGYGGSAFLGSPYGQPGASGIVILRYKF